MKQYDISGLHCAGCAARLEKNIKNLRGVKACSVNLLTNSMSVEGSVSDKEIIAAVKAAGFAAKAKADKTVDSDNLKDTETPRLKKRLVSSLGFLLVLMYISMGHNMWGLPVPAFMSPIAIALSQLFLALIVMVINKKFFTGGYKALFKASPNMDSLVALGSSAAFVYSLCVVLKMFTAAEPAHLLHELYFESAAMILTLITVGKMLEARSKGKTTDALKSLMKLKPKTATVIVDGAEREIEIEELKKGDIFVLRPGESVPADGVIVEGFSSFDESALTGESIPVDKKSGDSVYAATINMQGFVKCEALKVGEDSTLSQIIRMVSDAASGKAPIARLADKVSGIFVPVVIAIALVTLAVWLLLGREIGFALARAISVLVISCPCALGLATPVAIMVGSGVGAKKGILFKSAESLENTGKVQIVVLDKTGTLTEGKPSVTDVITAENVSRGELIGLAASLEACSEHPLAKAVISCAEAEGIGFEAVSDFTAVAGKGLEGQLCGNSLKGGSLNYVNLPACFEAQYESLANAGKTPLLFEKNGEFMGIIAVADTLKADSKEAVQELKNMGLEVVMLTGDNERTANAVGAALNVDKVVAGVLPEGKEQCIRQLKEKGKLAMVGDGINDAPALVRADVGIAIGAGADVAVDAAELVLMHGSIRDVAAAIKLSRAVIRNIRQNLFWAFFYNIIGIPLAAGAFVWAGLQLSPMIGAAAMSLSSFCVVSNALRLNKE